MFYHGLTRLKKFISQRTSKLCNKLFCLPTFSILCMRHLLYLIFQCDFDVTKSLKTLKQLNTEEAFTFQYSLIRKTLGLIRLYGFDSKLEIIGITRNLRKIQQKIRIFVLFCWQLVVVLFSHTKSAPTMNHQPASSIFLSQQVSASQQPQPAKHSEMRT